MAKPRCNGGWKRKIKSNSTYVLHRQHSTLIYNFFFVLYVARKSKLLERNNTLTHRSLYRWKQLFAHKKKSLFEEIQHRHTHTHKDTHTHMNIEHNRHPLRREFSLICFGGWNKTRKDRTIRHEHETHLSEKLSAWAHPRNKRNKKLGISVGGKKAQWKNTVNLCN